MQTISGWLIEEGRNNSDKSIRLDEVVTYPVARLNRLSFRRINYKSSSLLFVCAEMLDGAIIGCHIAPFDDDIDDYDKKMNNAYRVFRDAEIILQEGLSLDFQDIKKDF